MKDIITFIIMFNIKSYASISAHKNVMKIEDTNKILINLLLTKGKTDHTHQIIQLSNILGML